MRGADEWFDEPDELDRVNQVIQSVDHVVDAVSASALLAYRLARAQGFGEGNKRTAVLLAKWMLDHNGIDGSTILPTGDRVLADLLILAASGVDVEPEIVSLFKERARS